MKNKLFIIVIALVAMFAVGCSNKNNEFSEADALLLEDEFMDKSFPDRKEDGEIRDFKTKEELVGEISKVSEGYIAKSFVDTYYEEREGSLYVRGMDLPIRILKDQPVDFKKIDDDYELSQDGEDEKQGTYIFTVKYTRRDKDWIIKERIFESKENN